MDEDLALAQLDDGVLAADVRACDLNVVLGRAADGCELLRQPAPSSAMSRPVFAASISPDGMLPPRSSSIRSAPGRLMAFAAQYDALITGGLIKADEAPYKVAPRTPAGARAVVSCGE